MNSPGDTNRSGRLKIARYRLLFTPCRASCSMASGRQSDDFRASVRTHRGVNSTDTELRRKVNPMWRFLKVWYIISFENMLQNLEVEGNEVYGSEKKRGTAI